MALDDLPLGSPERSPAPPPHRHSSPVRWIAAVIAGLAAGALLTFWWMSRAQPRTASPAPTTATDVAVGSTRPKRQAIDLPPLDQSDSIVRSLVTALSKHPTMARLLATPALVRTTTLAVSEIGDGRTPADPLKVLRPSSRIQVTGGATGHIDPKSYARWDGTVAALTSVNPGDAAQLYVNVKPLFDQAYIELGHPGGDFDDAIVRAIDTLGDTPSPADDPVLLRRSASFEHDDPALRALLPVQKQFLLIGPDNRRRVMTWFKQFAADLELKVQ
jgi:hypothetical protein